MKERKKEYVKLDSSIPNNTKLILRVYSRVIFKKKLKKIACFLQYKIVHNLGGKRLFWRSGLNTNKKNMTE